VDFYDCNVEALHCTSPRDRMCTHALAHAHLGLLCRVVCRFLRSRIEYLEMPVWPGGQLEIVAGVGSFGVGDEFGEHIVGGSALFGEMQLPHALETRRLLNNVRSGGRSSFLRSVVHDRYTRRDGLEKHGAVALIPAVMRDHIDVNKTKLVIRTNELFLFVSREIAEV
jgi:hypothetical protein